MAVVQHIERKLRLNLKEDDKTYVISGMRQNRVFKTILIKVVEAFL